MAQRTPKTRHPTAADLAADLRRFVRLGGTADASGPTRGRGDLHPVARLGPDRARTPNTGPTAVLAVVLRPRSGTRAPPVDRAAARLRLRRPPWARPIRTSKPSTTGSSTFRDGCCEASVVGPRRGAAPLRRRARASWPASATRPASEDAPEAGRPGRPGDPGAESVGRPRCSSVLGLGGLHRHRAVDHGAFEAELGPPTRSWATRSTGVARLAWHSRPRPASRDRIGPNTRSLVSRLLRVPAGRGESEAPRGSSASPRGQESGPGQPAPIRLTPLDRPRLARSNCSMERWEGAEADRMPAMSMMHRRRPRPGQVAPGPRPQGARLATESRVADDCGNLANHRVVRLASSTGNSPLRPAIEYLRPRSLGFADLAEPGARLGLPCSARLRELGRSTTRRRTARLRLAPVDPRPARPCSRSWRGAPTGSRNGSSTALLDWLRAREAADRAGPLRRRKTCTGSTRPPSNCFGSFVDGDPGGRQGILGVFTTRPEYRPALELAGESDFTSVALTRLNRRQLVSEMMRRADGGRVSIPPIRGRPDPRADRRRPPLRRGVHSACSPKARAGLGRPRQSRLDDHRRDPLDRRSRSTLARSMLVARLDRVASRQGSRSSLARRSAGSFDFALIRRRLPNSTRITLRVRTGQARRRRHALRQGDAPVGASYTFKHALIQDSAYQLLIDQNPAARGIHLRIARDAGVAVPRDPRRPDPRSWPATSPRPERHRQGRSNYWLLAGQKLARSVGARRGPRAPRPGAQDLDRRTMPGLGRPRDALELTFRLPLSSSCGGDPGVRLARCRGT